MLLPAPYRNEIDFLLVEFAYIYVVTPNQLDKMKADMGGNSADGVGYSVVANAMPASQEAAPYLGRTHMAGSVV